MGSFDPTRPGEACECCGRSLAGKRTVWLELNCRTGDFSDPADGCLPDDISQGVFPFGATCARRALKESRRR